MGVFKYEIAGNTILSNVEAKWVRPKKLKFPYGVKVFATRRGVIWCFWWEGLIARATGNFPAVNVTSRQYKPLYLRWGAQLVVTAKPGNTFILAFS